MWLLSRTLDLFQKHFISSISFYVLFTFIDIHVWNELFYQFSQCILKKNKITNEINPPFPKNTQKHSDVSIEQVTLFNLQIKFHLESKFLCPPLYDWTIADTALSNQS